MESADALVAMVADCRVAKRRLLIVGHGSKPRRIAANRLNDVEELSTCDYRGILEYRPEELVITARSGTPLAELGAAVAAEGQLLPFDPPRFGGEGTLGGAIASGLSGPARPWRGSIHDAVLGVELINGLGERFAVRWQRDEERGWLRRVATGYGVHGFPGRGAECQRARAAGAGRGTDGLSALFRR